jgi:small conductance mechanosensitive channel
VTSSLVRIGEEVTATGRLVMQGELAAVLDRALEGGADLVVSLLPNVLSALVLGAFFYVLCFLSMRIARGFLGRSKRVDVGLERLLLTTLRVVCWTFILLSVLSQLGFDLSALIAGLGIAGPAVGFELTEGVRKALGKAGIEIPFPHLQLYVEGGAGLKELVAARSA